MMTITVAFPLLLLVCHVSGDLNTDLLQLTSEVRSFQLQTEVRAEQQQTEIDRLKKQLTGGHVAFSASLLPDGIFTIEISEAENNLVFKHVVTNIGNAYNPITGVFVAPLKGAYHFEWFIGGWGGTSTGAQLFKNTESIFLAFAHTQNRILSTSNGASLLLNPGDKVFLRMWSGSAVYDNFNHHTTFSGHLLFNM